MSYDEHILARTQCVLYGWGDSSRLANHPKIYDLQKALVDVVKGKNCLPPDHFCAGRPIAVLDEVNTCE